MLLSLKTFAQEDITVKIDTNDPLQNLKIGDKFKISKIANDTETFFDFTGLGIDDSLKDNISLTVKYFYDEVKPPEPRKDKSQKDREDYNNNKRTKEEIYIYPGVKFDSDGDYILGLNSFLLDYWGNAKILFNNVFKPSFIHPPEYTVFKTKFKSVVVYIEYKPYGKNSDFVFAYNFHGNNDGTGEVELVSYLLWKVESELNEDGDFSYWDSL